MGTREPNGTGKPCPPRCAQCPCPPPASQLPHCLPPSSSVCLSHFYRFRLKSRKAAKRRGSQHCRLSSLLRVAIEFLLVLQHFLSSSSLAATLLLSVANPDALHRASTHSFEKKEAFLQLLENIASFFFPRRVFYPSTVDCSFSLCVHCMVWFFVT